MRRFYLYRSHDVSGVSGTGIVAEGVEFSDGSAVLRWRSELSSTGFYKSVLELEKIHGHEGSTRLVWVDVVRMEAA